jgi:hypothetical protein
VDVNVITRFFSLKLRKKRFKGLWRRLIRALLAALNLGPWGAL